MKNQFLGKVFILYALINCLQCKHSSVNHKTNPEGSGTQNSGLVPVDGSQSFSGEAINTGAFMDTADKIVTTVCDTHNTCDETTTTKDGPSSEPLPVTDVATVSVKSCTTGTGPGGTDQCSEPVLLTKDDLVHSANTSDKGQGAATGAAIGAAVGVGAIALVGAFWYFKYFPMVKWNVKESYEVGRTFADGYPGAEAGALRSQSKLKGRSLFAFDLDETLIDETYKPEARYAGKGDVPSGWRELEMPNGKGEMVKIWVRKPKFKPGALESLARLIEAGHSVGLVSYNHRTAVGESLHQELLDHMRANGITIDGKTATIELIQDKFKISAPTVGTSGNPLKDFNATKSIFLDFEGGKAKLLEKLRAQFSGEFDAVFMSDDKDRFLDQTRRAKIKEPIIGLKVEGNVAAGKAAGLKKGGKVSDVRHLALVRGLTDPAEYAKFMDHVAKSRGNMLLSSDDLEKVMGKFGEGAKRAIVGNTPGKGFPDLLAQSPATHKYKSQFRFEVETDMRKPSKEVQGKDFGTGSKLKAFGAGFLIMGGVGAAATIGAGVGGAIDKANQN